MPGEFDDIRQRLELISEELADLAIVRLRESIDAGGTELPVDEKRLTRARLAVEKAIHILDEPDDPSTSDGGNLDRHCRTADRAALGRRRRAGRAEPAHARGGP